MFIFSLKEISFLLLLRLQVLTEFTLGTFLRFLCFFWVRSHKISAVSGLLAFTPECDVHAVHVTSAFVTSAA